MLPTIRSRCRNLKLKPLDADSFNAVMCHIASDMVADDLAILAQLSAHSPGIALDMHRQGAAEIYDQILGLLSPLPHIDTLKLHAFADRMTTGQAHANWQLLMRLVLCLFERAAKQAAGMPYDPISLGENGNP